MKDFWYFWYCQRDKVISFMIACGYVTLACFFGKVRDLLIVGNFLILAIALIWFGQQIGDYLLGLIRLTSFRNNPTFFTKLSGWILLLIIGIFLSQAFF